MDQAKVTKFIKMATELAITFSKDKEKQVGCIIIDPNTLFIKATGYNGFPLKVQDAPDRWERTVKQKYVQHAEMNAICSAARHGTSLDNSTSIVTYHPCSTCAKAMIQAGITSLVTPTPDYNHPRWGNEFKMASDLFKEAGVQVIFTVSCCSLPE